MTDALDRAKAIRAEEADRRARHEAEIERATASPRTPAGGSRRDGNRTEPFRLNNGHAPSDPPSSARYAHGCPLDVDLRSLPGGQDRPRCADGREPR
jgi:hypothetical protein